MSAKTKRARAAMPEQLSRIADDPEKNHYPVRGDERLRPGRCEESDEGHLVAVPQWPPRGSYKASKRTPSVSGVCEICRAHVIVYDPVQPGLRVKLPGGKIMVGDDAEFAED